MPKKNGVTKTFSFDRDIVSMLDDMCREERRTQTNLIELLIIEKYDNTRKSKVTFDGKTEDRN